jgi:hypothetical protein
MPLDGSSSASLKSMYVWMYLSFYKFFFIIFSNLHKALINLIICLIFFSIASYVNILTDSGGGWIFKCSEQVVYN